MKSGTQIAMFKHEGKEREWIASCLDCIVQTNKRQENKMTEPIRQCPTHKKYQGKRIPRNGCTNCMEVYYTFHPEKRPQSETPLSKGLESLDQYQNEKYITDAFLIMWNKIGQAIEEYLTSK